MRYRIFPQKSDVLAMFLSRLEACELRVANAATSAFPGISSFDVALAASLREEIALIQSHGPAEIAVELED